jgi:ATPase subunit of ABC transporter with duplicated ATPase domains
MLLTLQNLTYTYPGAAQPALAALDATFGPGWTGVVGSNGCGKSTLGRIVAGCLAPDAGVRAPRISGVYCEQDCSVEPPALFDFACDFAPDVVKLRHALGIADDMPWRFAELSCGEQKKVQVAVALWQRPEVLVLDEPTNHVDAACREQLVHALADYDGIGLLISHDRMLLDSLVTSCLCYEDGTWVMRSGTYSAARAQAGVERQTAIEQKASARKNAARLAAEAQARAEKASRTASRRSARSLDRHDSDGRERRRLAIVSGQDGKAGSLAARMGTRAEEAAHAAEVRFIAKHYDGSFRLSAPPLRRPVLLSVPAGSIPCGEGRLDFPTLNIGNTAHIGISGPNGAGKSTLLHYVTEGLERSGLGSHMLVIPQELDAAQVEELATWFGSLTNGEKGEVLSLVRKLETRVESLLEEGFSASPGMVRKLLVARAELDGSSILVMDEPTNHLDIHSVEALEQALASFGGALLIVSHDEPFLRACCTERWELSEGRVHRTG